MVALKEIENKKAPANFDEAFKLYLCSKLVSSEGGVEGFAHKVFLNTAKLTRLSMANEGVNSVKKNYSKPFTP